MKFFYTLILILSFSLSRSQIYTSGKIIGQDSCDFSNNCSIVQVDTNLENTWTYSNPKTKVLLRGGYNDSFALVTDNAQYYKLNSHSSFTVFKNTGEDHNYTDGNFLLSFRHKMNTDSAHDGGFIEISYDHGLTWENVILDQRNIEYRQPVFGLNMYTKEQLLANGQPGFSGDIQQWTSVDVPVSLYMLLKKPNAVIIRFTFVSDSISDEKEGWAIDNVKLSRLELPGGLNTLTSSSHVFSISPNPCLDELQITATTGELNGTVSIYSVEGKQVKAYALSNTQTQQFDINMLPAGMYSILYRDEAGTGYFHKFLKMGY